MKIVNIVTPAMMINIFKIVLISLSKIKLCNKNMIIVKTIPVIMLMCGKVTHKKLKDRQLSIPKLKVKNISLTLLTSLYASDIFIT